MMSFVFSGLSVAEQAAVEEGKSLSAHTASPAALLLEENIELGHVILPASHGSKTYSRVHIEQVQGHVAHVLCSQTLDLSRLIFIPG